MNSLKQLAEAIEQAFDKQVFRVEVLDCVTLEVQPQALLTVCQQLRDDSRFLFSTLLDVCGVDYLQYGCADWRTREATSSGYSRGVTEDGMHRVIPWDKPRYGVVYHLLSRAFNQRLRIKVYLEPEPVIPSVNNIWPSANWYEREAFDLFGVVFDGHPDLRRILTDYGFSGHPFRKDFPLIGEVEMRYDAEKEQCIYEPVSIQERVLVPKVIRQDNRYASTEFDEGDANG